MPHIRLWQPHTGEGFKVWASISTADIAVGISELADSRKQGIQ
jgi:hypothetical protein